MVRQSRRHVRRYVGRVGVILTCLACGCIRPTQLRSQEISPETALAAQLEGFATQIDDTYTRGDNGPYAMTPGCHLITTSAEPPRVQGGRISNPRMSSPGVGTGVRPVAVVYFIIDAKPGYRYVIERDNVLVDGRYRKVEVTLTAIAPDGTRVLRRGSSSSSVRPKACD